MQNEREDVVIDEGMNRFLVQSGLAVLRIELEEIREDVGRGVGVFAVLEEGEGLGEI